ncbi:MAG: glycosyltransferase family 4 protein [Pirellulales bacterium]
MAEHVEWRGFRKPIAPEFDSLDVLAFPSVLAEGMPMVLLEAFAAGVPIVGTSVPGTTDVLRDGENGLLVEPQCPEELAAALARLLDDRPLRTAVRRHGLRDHAERYSDTVMAKRIAAAYRRVLDA